MGKAIAIEIKSTETEPDQEERRHPPDQQLLIPVGK